MAKWNSKFLKRYATISPINPASTLDFPIRHLYHDEMNLV